MRRMLMLVFMVVFPKLALAQFSWSWQQSIDPLKYWSLVIKVNKAPRGQTMEIYEKGNLIKRFKVSTGREKVEISKSGREYFSGTPVGWFSPQSLVPLHRSKTWDSDMPWSVFIYYGIAIHGVGPSLYSQLGTPASGGCVRLALHEAKFVYELVQRHGFGKVPVVSLNGVVKKTADGEIALRRGWNTIVIIED